MSLYIRADLCQGEEESQREERERDPSITTKEEETNVPLSESKGLCVTFFSHRKCERKWEETKKARRGSEREMRREIGEGKAEETHRKTSMVHTSDRRDKKKQKVSWLKPTAQHDLTAHSLR